MKREPQARPTSETAVWRFSLPANGKVDETLMLLTENTQQLLRIEAKLDLLMRHLKVEFDATEAVAGLARDGKTLAAMRLHRSCFKSSIAAAKKDVDRLSAKPAR